MKGSEQQKDIALTGGKKFYQKIYDNKEIYVKKIAYNKRKIIGLCTCVYFLKKDFFDEKKRVLFAKLNPSTAAGIDAVFNATVAVPGIYALLDFYLSGLSESKESEEIRKLLNRQGELEKLKARVESVNSVIASMFKQGQNSHELKDSLDKSEVEGLHESLKRIAFLLSGGEVIENKGPGPEFNE
jgi:hypothetical protein